MKHTDELKHGNASGAPEHPDVSFERQDINAPHVEKLGLTLGAVIVVVLVLLVGMLRVLTKEEAAGPAAPALAPRAGQQLPPEPRMQGVPGDALSPPEQFKRFQAAAEAQLNSYGWVDSKQGIARIPVSEAMKMLAEKGLPEVPAPVKTGSSPQSMKEKK